MTDFLRLVSRTVKLDKNRLLSNKLNSVFSEKTVNDVTSKLNDQSNDEKSIKKRNLDGTQINHRQKKKRKLSQSQQSNDNSSDLNDDDQRQYTNDGFDNNDDITSDESDTEYNHIRLHDSKLSLREKLRIIKRFRRHHSINVHGTDIPPPIQSFNDLHEIYKIQKWIINNVTAPIPNGCGFEYPTAIQMQSITCLLGKRDLLATAPTG